MQPFKFIQLLTVILWEDVWSRWTLDYTLALILPCVVGPRMQSGRMKQTGMLSNVIVYRDQADLRQAHAHMHIHTLARAHTLRCDSASGRATPAVLASLESAPRTAAAVSQYL